MSSTQLFNSPELDEKDLKILRILSRNARAPFSEIAREVELSDVAVMKRVRKLEQLGIIKKYTIVVDPRKLGYRSVSITGIDVEPEHLFSVVDKLKTMPNVKFLAITSGDHSIMTIIWARDSEEISKIHEELSKIRGVKRVCPAIVLDVIKEETI